MRRGHPGIGGWRSENPRHFRPRNAGTHQFGPPRPPFSMHDLPRYPHPAPRTYRCRTPFNTQHMHLDRQGPQDHHDTDYTNRSKNFRHDRGRRNTRQTPFYEGHRHNELETSSRFNDKYNYYDNVPEHDRSHINSMGDIDHRLPMNNSHKKNLHKHQPWAIPPQDFKRYYHENNVKETNHYNANAEANRLTAFDSSGHRPPSSDHYGSTPRSSVENNNVFSHSVDDTVDIVRKRLLNRNDQQQTSLDQPTDEHSSVDENVTNRRRSYQNDSLEQTPKRRAPQQQVQNQMIVKKADCDKVKNKIVQTFFNMNKRGIHKLIDNPSSSAKFEYAISSLIMETQITLNSHQRSAAEKTLMSSADFIHSDKNTAFEDTFMKQMQCILDPQDTVLLEDIKPVIMAEMTKVLKLDDTEYHLDAANPGDFLPRQEQQHYDFYANPNNNLMSLAQDSFDEMPTYEETESVNDEVDIKYDYTKQMDYVASKPLYERRPTRTSSEQSQNSQLSFDNRQHVRRSFDNPTEAMSDEPLPLFESNTELLSDDDDPFAELDNQYHVPVDHNFIENDDLPNAEQMATNSGRSPILQTDTIPNLQTSIESSIEIKKEIDDQLQSIAKSPLKLFSPSSKDEFREQQALHDHNSNKNNDVTTSTHDVCNNGSRPTNNMNRTQEFMDKGKDQIDNVNIMNNVPKCSTSSTRKRSIDQKPSHRKEKRKKSESSPSQTNKETLDKYITVNDKFPLNNGEDTAKTTQESVVTNNVVEVGRKYRKTEKSTKRYSEKFVKRKEIQKKSTAKEKKGEVMNRRKSTSHSLSPIDTNKTIINSETPSKANGKIKLKTIDMFIEQPKKVAVHQAHRNTAVSTSVGAAPKPVEDPKAKQQDPTPCKINKKNTLTSPCKKLNTKETQTVHGKLISRLCQTDKNKVSTKATQTDTVSSESTSRNPNTYERMKDIDLEIQALLQEKFQLYNSLESGAANPSAMQTLGMAVLNVPLETEQDGDGTEIILSEDTIVEEFTSIPVEELEQIALETVQDDNAEVQKPAARSRRVRQLEQDRESSESPSTSNTKRNNRKTKGPNISLIEQIITDDRPLEDIISLDVLEEVEKQLPRVRKRSIKSVKVPRRRVTKKSKSKVVLDNKCNLKECSVVLLREDFDKYLTAESVESESIDTEDSEEVVITEVPSVYHEHNEEAEDSVNSFLQFDMLDVSEDIVIGDSYEMKCDDRDNFDRADVSINEEIILDNSQSSMEDLVSDASQEENECKMFDYSTDENLRRDSVLVSGHADAVLAIECVENDFIAACLDGNVYHFCSDGRLVNTLRGSNLAVTCLTIVREPHGTTVYTGSLDSRIRYYDLETGLEKGPECNVLSPIQTMDRAWDTVFVGTRTGFVLQFECKNNLLIPVSTVKFSDQSILALRALKEGPRKVLLVAARSENVTIKDAQSGLLLRTLQGPKMTVYTLLFEDGKVYCGTSSHQIHVFDYASGGHAGVHSGGKGAVCLRATGGLVFAGCYDGCVYVYREGQPRPLAQLRGPSLMLLSLAVRGSKLIVGYKDRSLYIWKIPLIILQEMIL